MASLEELTNLVQQLQRQVIEYRQDILLVENNLINTQKELEQTKQKLQESQIQQNGNLETQIQRFNTLIDKLKNSEGKTLKFACGSTEPGNTQWEQRHPDVIAVDIDTSSAGFSEEPYYFTSIRGNSGHWATTGATSIYPSENKGWNEGFTIILHFVREITPAQANECKWHIQWLAVGI